MWYDAWSCAPGTVLPSSLLDVCGGIFHLLAPTAPPAAAAAAVSAPASSCLRSAFFFLFLLLPLPPPWAYVSALGLLSPFTTWATGGCQARPSATLAHLSARLKRAEISWMSWVVRFSSIFSSITPW
jgi:hypothetical protein